MKFLFSLSLLLAAGLLIPAASVTTLRADDAAEKKAEEKKAEEKKPEEKKAEEKPAEKKDEAKKDEEKKPAEKKDGDKPAPEAPAITPEVLVTNLENPSGLAIHSENGHVFIASRYGVYRYTPDTHKAYLEVIGYPEDIYGKGPKYTVGPLGLAFLDKEHLVVGDGSRPDGEELVRVYKVPGAPPETPQQEAKAAYTLGPLPKGEKTAKGEGNFYGVAVGGGAIFITCNGDDTKGWIAKAPIADGKPGTLELSIATKEATEVDAPVPAIFSPDGTELVVGQMGEMNVAGDSLLTTYDPKTGELKKSYKTGLSDIAGLAYSPKTGSLYATDFSWVDPSQGGLFRLVIEGDEVKAEKVLTLDKPAAIAFGKDGKLYLTTFGTGEKDSDKSPGTLQVISEEAGL